jgi:hypothetical protein
MVTFTHKWHYRIKQHESRNAFKLHSIILRFNIKI